MTMLTVKRKPNGMPSFGNVFDEFFNDHFPVRTFNKGEFFPSVNVAENEKEFKLEFAVPGFEKKDFSIDIEKDQIRISGKKEMTEESKEKNYTRKEFSFSKFSRSFSIPENVDTEKIEALYENGILHLSLPKKEVKENSKSQKIEIK